MSGFLHFAARDRLLRELRWNRYGVASKKPASASGCGGTGSSAASPLLADAPWHRHRRVSLHPNPWRSQCHLTPFFSSQLRHHAFDLPSEIVMRPPHGAIGNRRMSLHGPTNPTSIDSYPTFLMMNRSKTTSPVRALTTLSPATSTAMGSSFGPKDPMNLNVISGGLGVGVGGGGGGGSQGPRNRGSPQTGAGVGVGSCVGIGVGVGGRKSKMFRK